ncbi:MAG: hypothetical protein PHV78_02735 [Patescibacteria group bacterium]|nr:hypothetical protein [Patescibacteria group bacterium]MDD5121697.1 hypothetical protein [Patescibacteria group bacterium]MDD5221692.1 hypothetical protein [Patescibacteria group bacterium]MDD5396139.1 hypothetical protein [Patescibacteria group bacterium]
MIDILYFPIWWYTIGLIKRLKGFIDNLNYLSRYLAIKILLANLFKPMFGQYSWQGRIISFFMRILQLAFSLVVFVLGTIFFLAILILWIVTIPIAVIQIIRLASLF